jgi:hypothetical protein
MSAIPRKTGRRTTTLFEAHTMHGPIGIGTSLWIFGNFGNPPTLQKDDELAIIGTVNNTSATVLRCAQSEAAEIQLKNDGFIWLMTPAKMPLSTGQTASVFNGKTG